MKKLLIAFAIVVVIVGGIALWYFVFDDDSLDVSTSNIESSKSLDGIEERDTVDGTWTLQKQDDVFAGYEIQELFNGDSVKKTAVGKSEEVSGSFTIKDNILSEGKIEVDLTDLQSDSGTRDSKMEDEGLEISKFPKTAFTQSTEVDLSDLVIKGEDIELLVPGTLSLHGIEKEVEFPLNVNWDGKVIRISGELAIVLSDYEIKPPKSPFVSVDDNGKIKIQLLFIPA